MTPTSAVPAETSRRASAPTGVEREAGDSFGQRAGDPTGLNAASLITGVVEQGDQRGRTIGFPTANVRLTSAHGGLDDGVYAALVQLTDGRIVGAAVSIGRRPTFYVEGERLLEAHLIAFAGDLYGTTIRVALLWFLRRQTRFDRLDELVFQLRADVEQCRELLATSGAIERRDIGHPVWRAHADAQYKTAKDES